MRNSQDDTFIYTTNHKKIGARAKLNGQPALAIFKNNRIEGYITASELSQLLYDSRKPFINIEQNQPIQDKITYPTTNV